MPQKDVANSFTDYIRNASKISCSIEGCEDQIPDIRDRIISHFERCHPSYLEHKSLEEAIQSFRRGGATNSQDHSRPSQSVATGERSCMIRAPDTPLIPETQLIAEVKSIYAGLIWVESKKIKVDNDPSTLSDTKVNNEQWQALIALYRSFIYERCDLLLASQNPASKRLAAKYGRHGPCRYIKTSGVSPPSTLAESDNEILSAVEGHLNHIRKPWPTYDDDLIANHMRARRGRGARRNAAYWKARNDDPNADLFDERELLFSDRYGGLKISRLANLDTQLKIGKGREDDLIMSSHCASELGVLDQISTDFEDPCLQSISGHSTAVRGILRNVQFRLKGSSVTFCRNFWICDAIDGIVDVMMGANFIKRNFKMLFEKVKECASSFATWFSKKKETPEQKNEREELERQQKIKINELEIKRLQRENEMHRRASERNSNNGTGGVHQGSA